MAKCFENGTGVDADQGAALFWYRKGSYLGDVRCTYHVARCLHNGIGIEPEVGIAVNIYNEAAEKGDCCAMNQLGQFHSSQIPTDITLSVDDYLAFSYFSRAAEKGCVAAMSNLGRVYRQGIGVDQNLDKAVEWLRKASARGNANAELELLSAHTIGQVALPDDELETIKSHMAINNPGEFELINALGRMDSSETAEDVSKVVSDFERAYQLGKVEAAGFIAFCLHALDGEGETTEHTRDALQWCKRGEEQDCPCAMVVHGFFLMKGYGVELDQAEGRRLFEEAGKAADARIAPFVSMIASLARH